jgi:predicted AlkP superfamily phosphohydrolase/phosphomutase/tetratricopeptide (TPR) repeat protein
MDTRKVLLIGWDGADWKVIHPLLDAGKMPNLAALIENGVMGNLSSLRPELSPMLWTSIATGKRPYKHGILGFTEPNPNGVGIRPVSNISRKTKTIWNILNQNDHRPVVIGWWPSHPAEPINGVMVSNHLQRAVAPHGKPWPMVPGTVHPPRLVGPIGKLRVHPQDLHSGLMRLFVPDLADIDQEKDFRIETIAKIIAEATTIKDVALATLQHEPWDFAAVYFDAVDHLSHAFMNYHPPRLSWVSEKEYDRYNKVIESGYILHDHFLGALLQQCYEETTVMLISDHGFHSDHLRPSLIPGEPAGAAAQHRPYGIVVLRGPRTKRDEILFGASLLDICPTILSLFGLPVGEDMDGRPLVNGFQGLGRTTFIPSWDEAPGDDGGHPSDYLLDPYESSAAINRLVELGYIDHPSDDHQEAVAHTLRENQYNLARSYMDGGFHTKAMVILEELWEEWPGEYRFGVELAYCLQAIGRAEQSLPLLENILREKKVKAAGAQKELRQCIKDKGARCTAEDLDAQESERIMKLRLDAGYNTYSVNYLLGVACLSMEEYAKSLDYFRQAGQSDPSHPALYIHVGQVYEKMKKPDKAGAAYEKALAIDPENAEAMLGLCRHRLSLRRNDEAAHFALDALGLRYHNPFAHFLLGCALHRLGKLVEAVDAFEIAVRQNPNFPEALRRLATIHGKRLADPERTEKYRLLAREASLRIRRIQRGELSDVPDGRPLPEALASDMIGSRADHREWPAPADLEETIIVVSGLPRSGTSMMMQMLGAGGIPLYADQMRPADEDNPKGYFESEPVKRLSRDSSWLDQVKGKGIKVISHLLPYLLRNNGRVLRIIFMERNYDEILASQKKMLARRDRKASKLSDLLLKNTFMKHQDRIFSMPAVRNIPSLHINYEDCIADPLEAAEMVNRFLGGGCDSSLMAAEVDKTLHHQKKREGV